MSNKRDNYIPLLIISVLLISPNVFGDEWPVHGGHPITSAFGPLPGSSRGPLWSPGFGLICAMNGGKNEDEPLPWRQVTSGSRRTKTWRNA